MSHYLVAPAGRLIQGHVLDVGKRAFSEALRFYDPLLYVKWNPIKLKGHGCWEIRRRPEMKSVKDVVVFEGNTYITTDYHEIDIVNHVLDCAFLNYDQIRKLKEMDTFTNGLGKNFSAHVESWERDQKARNRAKGLEESQHAAKQFKHEIADFKEMVASGLNPAELATHWNSV